MPDTTTDSITALPHAIRTDSITSLPSPIRTDSIVPFPHAFAGDSIAPFPYALGSDSIALDSTRRAPGHLVHDWKTLLKGRRLKIEDTNVHYPRFIDFCVRVYRWAVKNFNTYDPAYVVGTGKHGKLKLASDNWLDSYYFRIPGGIPLEMLSHPYSNIGVSANYSILSLGYSFDLNSLIKGTKSTHKHFSASFACARLLADAYFWKNDGTTVIRRLGNDATGKFRNEEFTGVDFKTLGMKALYIFNYKKFSYPAAYNMAMYQRRSAGSWMLGLSGEFIDCTFDFEKLPENVSEQMALPFDSYRLDFNSVNIVGGYSYNWVLGRHWLYNITMLPGIGMTFSFTDSTTGHKTLASAMLRGRMSINYVSRQYFINASAGFDGNFFITKSVRFLSGLGNFQISTGVRF